MELVVMRQLSFRYCVLFLLIAGIQCHDHSLSIPHGHSNNFTHDHTHSGGDNIHSSDHTHNEAANNSKASNNITLPAFIQNFEEKIVACYFRESSVNSSLGNDSYDVNYIPVSLCTHVHYGYAKIDLTTGGLEITRPELAHSFIEKLTNDSTIDRTAIPMLSVGGPGEDLSAWQQVTQTAERRETFINSTLLVMSMYGFKGVDISWQYPTASDRHNFGLLIEELNERIKSTTDVHHLANLTLTVTVNPSSSYQNMSYNVTQLCSAADHINLLTYDIHSSTHDNTTGYSSPLFSSDLETQPDDVVNVTVHKWIEAGCEPKQMILGLAMHGHLWSLSDETRATISSKNRGLNLQSSVASSAGIVSRSEICDFIRVQRWSRGLDSQAWQQYAHSHNKWLTFESSRTIAKKLAFISFNGLGGAFISALDMADYKTASGCRRDGGRDYLNGNYRLIKVISMISNVDELHKHFSSIPTMRQLSRMNRRGLRRVRNFWLNTNMTEVSPELLHRIANNTDNTM